MPVRLAALLNPRGYARETQLSHALRSVPLFKNLPAGDLVALWRRLEQVRAEPGAIVCRRGDPGDAFYAIQSGSLQVCLGIGEDSINLRRLEAGDSFGEMALLTGEPRSADILALDECVLWALDRASFEDVTAHSVPLLKALNRDLAARIGALTLQFEALERRFGDGARGTGIRLGPYRAVEQIGAGGMAVVFSAVHSDTEAAAAVKVLPPAWGAVAEHRERFQREIAVLQLLDHPNVVRLLDSGSVDEAPGAGQGFYVAMEWLPHPRLAEAL
jgi:CRP-like cAMP-binding protein